ncbi:MAG: hypothetical protein KC729_09365 [Candidatus Eisenbacteria bacterium]|uniref:Uncharacterized protein n=1 Tax=Eiseniibacteriota bacterium TaxID=2212470 RepID=A0A956LZ53_UNCEI|nr:hypothetical protein [Candidatus Eisenbacteria bacterium]
MFPSPRIQPTSGVLRSLRPLRSSRAFRSFRAVAGGRIRWQIVGSVLALLSTLSCSKAPDPDQPYYMEMNGRHLEVPLKPGAAFVDRYEDDYAVYRHFGIRFPAGRGMATLEPGIEIRFDPDSIASGDVIDFDGRFGDIVRVSYTPASGHVMSEARILSFTVQEGDTGTVIFDEFDPSPGGHVSGSLVDAVLYGHFEDVDDGEWVDTDEPMRLVLRNFDFDCVMPQYD